MALGAEPADLADAGSAKVAWLIRSQLCNSSQLYNLSDENWMILVRVHGYFYKNRNSDIQNDDLFWMVWDTKPADLADAESELISCLARGQIR